jgi:hypothetical protein
MVLASATPLPTETVLLPTYVERLGEPGALGIVISALALGEPGPARASIQFRGVVPFRGV